MANQFTDNGEFYGTSNLPGPYTAVYGGGNVTVSGGKLVFTSNGGLLVSDGITAQGTWFANIRLNIQNAPTGSNPGFLTNAWPVICWNDAGNHQCGLYIRNDGRFVFARGETAIGAASLMAVDFDADLTYYDIEAKVVFGNSGTVELRVNGNTEISSTVDNTSTANNTADSIQIGQNGGGSSTVNSTVRIKHVILFDSTGSAMNTFLGPVTVYWNQVTADGAHTGRSPVQHVEQGQQEQHGRRGVMGREIGVIY